MRWISSSAFVVLLLFASSDSGAAKPKVTMYGAEWCGPCKRLRTWFGKNAIAYEYLDIDIDVNRVAFERASGKRGGIPLTVIGAERVRGADTVSIAKLLGKTAAQPRRSAPGTARYGGRTKEEWQREFKELRGYIEQLAASVKRFERVAVDHVEKEQLEKARKTLLIAEASLTQLDNEASKFALPRASRW